MTNQDSVTREVIATGPYGGKHPHDYQRPTPEQVADISTIRNKVKELHDTIESVCPKGEYRVDALKHLDVVSAIANKAVVMGPRWPDALVIVEDADGNVEAPQS